MKAAPVYFGVVLAFLGTSTGFGQQSNQFVYIEGTVQKANGSPWAGARLLLSNGSTFTTNNAGHYFAVVPSGFSGTVTPSLPGYTLSPAVRSYTNIAEDQLGQNFATGTYTVTGTISDGVTDALPAIYFDALGQGAVRKGDGTYGITIPYGVTGTATPLSLGINYEPSSRTFSPAASSNQNYVRTSFKYAGVSWGLNSTGQPGCYYQGLSSTFLYPPQTGRIYASVFSSGAQGNVLPFSWFDPSGVLRYKTTYAFANTAGVCAMSSLNVAGTDVARTPGIWAVTFPAIDTGNSQHVIASIPFAVLSQNQPPSLSGSMAHLASGDGWDSTIQFVNTGSSSVQASIGFVADDGNPLPLPVVPGYLPTASVFRTLAPNSMLAIDSTSPDVLQTGYAWITTVAGVSGFIRFRYAPRDQEAIVPLETRKASSYTLAFDNRSGIATGAAVANLLAVPANIPVLIRDNTGAQIGSANVSLPANGHAAFVLTDRFSSTVNQTGTIEFDTPPSGQITVLGLRFPPSGKFTTIPVLANTDTGGGSMAHLAVGDGWTTTIELVNYGTTFAQASLSFFADSGAPLSVPWTVSGNASSASVLNQTLAPHARLVIQSVTLS